MDRRGARLLLASLLLAGPAYGGTVRLRGKLKAKNASIVALGPRGSAVLSRRRKFKLRAEAPGRLVVLGSDTSVRGPVVLGILSGGSVLPVRRARKRGVCKRSDARAVMRFTAGRKRLNLRRLVVEDDVAYPARRLPKRALDRNEGLARVDENCVPIGAGKLGIVRITAGATAPARAGEAAQSSDADADGLPDPIDADDDGDGVLDNDDPDAMPGGGGPTGEQQFWVFSNFHRELESSLNANAMAVTKEMIDAALVESLGLALHVIGDGTIPDVELDCGTLEYCSAGGTGRTSEPYPDGLKFPEDLDTDGDGLGSMVIGPSGDFQLIPFAEASPDYPASDKLKAGDIYFETYTDDSGNTVAVPGMLNFVFHTTPAVKTVETGVRTYDVTYPVGPNDPGTRANPFHVPTTGDVLVTLTVWRPQRAGVTEAGEAPLMDMGNLRLLTNLPNGPCGTQPHSSCEPGPGVCPTSVYSTSDPNLTIEGTGLQDHLGDQPADPAHTFTYTIDLSACVEGVPGVSWDPGEVVGVPVQMMNFFGDNAAQNIYFIRDDS